MHYKKINKVISIAVGCLVMSTMAQADFSANMSRIDGASGSGHKVIDECGNGTENWDDAIATIENVQSGGSSRVNIALEGAASNTLYTVWVRLKGQSHGNTFGGSPITGGGATPLAPSTSLGSLVNDWVGLGSRSQPNGFKTNHLGNGVMQLELDFPLEGGAYPFNNILEDDLAIAQNKRPAALTTPTAFVDPRNENVGPGGTPFLVRMVSHCQDRKGHGLSPGNREAWFQYP